MSERGWGFARGATPPQRKRKAGEDEDMDDKDDDTPPAAPTARNAPPSPQAIPLPVAGIGRPLILPAHKRLRPANPAEDSDDRIRERIQAAQTAPGQVPADLPQALAALDRDQLLALMGQLLRQSPHLGAQVAALLPRPTVHSTAALLAALERRLADAFPYSRAGPDRGDYAFNRVRPALAELKHALLAHLATFCARAAYPADGGREHAADAFAYLDLATAMAHRLPAWDNPDRSREFRADVYARLARAWRDTVAEVAATVAGGAVFGASAIAEWGRLLAGHADRVGGEHGFREAVFEYKVALGVWVNLFPTEEEAEEYTRRRQAEQQRGAAGSAGGAGGQGRAAYPDPAPAAGGAFAAGGLSGIPAAFPTHPAFLELRPSFGFT